MNWEVQTMRSKTSFFNATLFRRNLTRFWPLWGGASLLGSLFPLALLLQLMRGSLDGYFGEGAPGFTQAYYQVLVYAVPIISLLYAVLCAMVVWSYLYNPRSVGLMHTLPIRREGLFATNFLSGMAMLLIPYAVTGALCILLSVAYGGFDPVGLLMTILGVLGESFFYFASATFAAFVTGNLFALPALYFLLHFLAPLLDLLLTLFATEFLFGISRSYSGAADFLSPTVYLMEKLRVAGTYEEVRRQVTDGSRYYTFNRLVAVDLENFWLIGVYALAGAALLALAWMLYRRRRSETAGDVVAVGWMRPVFRFGLAALASLLGGQALYALFWSSFQEGQYYEALPMAVCMLAAGTVGYYAASMLLAKSLRVFKGSWKGLLLVATGCAALCCVLRFDLLGISRRVPEASRTDYVKLRVAENTYTFYTGEDDALLEQVRALHRAIAEDQDYIRDYTGAVPADGGKQTYTYANLVYHLSDGLEVERSYSIPLTSDRLAREGTYDYLLDRLVNSETMKARRLHAGDSRYAAEGGSLYLERSGQGVDLSSREAAAILAAVAKDAASGAWGDYDWFDEDYRDQYAMDLNLEFSYKLTDDTGYDWIGIIVRPGMENTVACLKELDLVTDRDLVTYREWDAEDESAGEELPLTGDGIIGGADGVTAVYVAE